jgi:FkbM family methyltransferase
MLRWRAWEDMHFGEPELRLLKYLVDPRKSAIDIGGAEGVYAFHLQQLAQHCIVFEPNPTFCSNLKRALPSAEIHQAAVSRAEGEATLRVPLVNAVPYSGWGTIEPKNRFSELPPHTVEEIKVQTVRPDRMQLTDVGFVKIDVEGHELDVIAGLTDLLIKCRPNLLVEIGDDQRGGSLADLRCSLDRVGYIGLRLDERGMLRVLADEIEFKGSMNAIFIATKGICPGLGQ